VKTKVNINDLCEAIAKEEAGKRQVDIAQIHDVIHAACHFFARLSFCQWWKLVRHMRQIGRQ
jgi:hypothetical protein